MHLDHHHEYEEPLLLQKKNSYCTAIAAYVCLSLVCLHKVFTEKNQTDNQKDSSVKIIASLGEPEDRHHNIEQLSQRIALKMNATLLAEIMKKILSHAEVFDETLAQLSWELPEELQTDLVDSAKILVEEPTLAPHLARSIKQHLIFNAKSEMESGLYRLIPDDCAALQDPERVKRCAECFMQERKRREIALLTK